MQHLDVGEQNSMFYDQNMWIRFEVYTCNDVDVIALDQVVSLRFTTTLLYAPTEEKVSHPRHTGACKSLATVHTCKVLNLNGCSVIAPKNKITSRSRPQKKYLVKNLNNLETHCGAIEVVCDYHLKSEADTEIGDKIANLDRKWQGFCTRKRGSNETPMSVAVEIGKGLLRSHDGRDLGSSYADLGREKGYGVEGAP
ncbi:hypothetical protein E2542_SST20937 [Spatholobus suberectus]|nr:hypothetical protein E2542_SST20937 [Spatholobus suberectus]